MTHVQNLWIWKHHLTSVCETILWDLRMTSSHLFAKKLCVQKKQIDSHVADRPNLPSHVGFSMFFFTSWICWLANWFFNKKHQQWGQWKHQQPLYGYILDQWLSDSFRSADPKVCQREKSGSGTTGWKHRLGSCTGVFEGCNGVGCPTSGWMVPSPLNAGASLAWI